jgi:hypothetical protein
MSQGECDLVFVGSWFVSVYNSDRLGAVFY